jgi:diadenosine tetraphosphate (Ap4A) HIT family hydrolase
MMKAGFGGFNVIQNNYPDGGQAIPHIHLHVIPRQKGRKGRLAWLSNSNPYADDAERASYAERLRAALA